jgi:signal transduction histidine kinase
VIQRQISFTREYQEMGRQPSDWYNLGNLLEKVLGTGVAGSIHVTNEAENLEIFADPVIEKVFWHLIDNSKKHGEKVTNIRIFAAESASGCTLVYQDDGIGIPQDMKNKLFTRSADKITGFDLFMVHDILDICEMKIAETGEPGTGVKFEISIPGGRYRLVGI